MIDQKIMHIAIYKANSIMNHNNGDDEGVGVNHKIAKFIYNFS